MGDHVRIGSAYKASYSLADGATVTAHVQTPDGAWHELALVEVSTPAGHDRLFTADYTPSVVGWHIISYDTDPTGGESMQKFYVTSEIDGFATYAFGTATTVEV